jgi:glycosyltransferase involved in cell wall biosynthesis
MKLVTLQCTQMSMSSSESLSSPTTHPIGVIIPTYNRAADLIECLRHLAAQTWQDFEVLIVDDGSTDDTASRVEQYQATAPFPLRYLYQANNGPAKARNVALANMSSPVSILIGDDIFPTPDFVRLHLEFHRSQPQLEAVAVGLTRWSERGQVVTPFMRWLDRDGLQFAYGDLLNGITPSWKHFYTSNLSFKTAYVRRNPFHEGFPKASMEDIELGYRLAAEHNLAMFFLPNAIADHLHPTSFKRACRRAIDVGAAGHLFDELWPSQRHPPSGSFLHRNLSFLVLEPRVILPSLTTAVELLNRLWFPNPIMKKVLDLHHRLGRRQEAVKKERKG